MRTVITNLAVMLIGVALFFSTLGQANSSQQYGVMGLTPTAEPPTPLPTNTPTPTMAPTNTPVPTEAPTNTPVPTEAPTNTPIPTTVPTNTPVPTTVPTNTPVPTTVPTNTPVPTEAPTPPRVDDEPTSVVEQSDPALDKRVSPSAATVGDVVEYTLTVTNQGSTPASDVVVDDPLPSFLELISVNASRGEVSSSGSTVRVVIGELAVDDSIRITIFARVTQVVAAPQNLNQATLTTSSRTDAVANNTATAAITVSEAAAPPAVTQTPTTETATPEATAIPASPPAASPAPTTPSNNQQIISPAPRSQQQAKPVQAKPAAKQSRPPAILSRTGMNGWLHIPLTYVVALTFLAFGSGMLVRMYLIMRHSKR